jgi:RND family efflux transporter MFP subunit
MSTRVKAYGFVLAVAMLASAGFLAKAWLAEGADVATDDAAGAWEDDAVPVSVELAVQGPISHTLGSTANLRAHRQVEIATQTAGLVTAVQAEEGDFVRTGQVLCSLDDRDLQIDLELSQQRLAQTKIQLEAASIRRDQAEAKLRNKRAELQRNEEALSQGLLADSEVAVQRHEIEDIEHDLRIVDSTVRENRFKQQELEAQIRKVRLQISQASITAPFAGRITERTVELGQSLNVSDKLFKIGAFSPLYADVYLAERDSRAAEAGQPTTVRLGPLDSEVASGRVERVSPVVDEQTGTVKVTVRFEPPNRGFRPGAFVRVDIETNTDSDAVLIPKQAVIEEDGILYVVLIGKDGMARRVAVELGYQNEADVQVNSGVHEGENEADVQVSSGVHEGETVVVAGQGRLKDGDKTRVVSD